MLGHNGSGKSTLAKLLNMILLPDSGRIVIDGRWITPDMDDDEVAAVRRDIGMVFQNPDNQIVATVVEEDVAFGPENLGVPPEQIRARVDAALEAVGMTEFARHSPHQLSGGQKQRGGYRRRYRDGASLHHIRRIDRDARSAGTCGGHADDRQTQPREGHNRAAYYAQYERGDRG